MSRIGILEDEAPQAAQLRMWLDAAGHRCIVYARGQTLMREALRDSWDMFLLDWNVPDVSGEKVLEWLRARIRDPLPILFTTARDSESDIARILNAGADDYLVKPLRHLETMARVEAVLRRARPPARRDEPVQLDGIRLVPSERRAYLGDAAVPLTQREFDLALLFFREPDRLFSRGHIMDTVWGPTAGHVTTRSVDTHVSALRRKLGLGAAVKLRLTSVYQHGYRLERTGRAQAA